MIYHGLFIGGEERSWLMVVGNGLVLGFFFV
jgi:hypothetical protein